VLESEEDGIVFQCWCAMALYTTVPSFWFWMHNDVIDSTSWRDLVFRRTPQLCDLAGSCIEALLGSIEACWSSDWSAGQWTRFSWPAPQSFGGAPMTARPGIRQEGHCCSSTQPLFTVGGSGTLDVCCRAT
jgi:hypothetical protein